MLLKAAELSRSTYYYELKKIDMDYKNTTIIDEMKKIFEHHRKRYGVLRITSELRNKGFKVNHKKVQRLMKKFHLKALKRKEKYHSYMGHVGAVADNIIARNFVAAKPNQKWSTDISQFKLGFGKVYFSPIIDMCTGEIIAYDIALSPDFAQINRMLDRAFAMHPNLEGLVFHSDQGWQYQMKEYGARLKAKGIIQSMSRKGNCLDNCVMESVFGIIKNEMFYGHEKEFQTFEQFKVALEDYILYYNTERIKKKAMYQSPSQYRSSFNYSLC